MQSVSLTRNNGAPVNVLCLGAHSDDIEIGCGGAMLSMIADGVPLNVYWAVFCAQHERAEEARKSADALLAGVRSSTVAVASFRDGFLPYEGTAVKEHFEAIKSAFAPEMIFTHYRDDRHQDHRLIAELTWNTWRDNFILEYEVPKYDGDFGSPNLFVPLSDALCRRKVDHILSAFPSQRRAKHWFSEDTFVAVARLRGMEAGPGHRFAEAFYCRKAVLR